MRLFLSRDGSCGDVEPMVTPEVQLGALGAKAGVCTSPDLSDLPTGGCR